LGSKFVIYLLAGLAAELSPASQGRVNLELDHSLSGLNYKPKT